jgi:hypothetical protein
MELPPKIQMESPSGRITHLQVLTTHFTFFAATSIFDRTVTRPHLSRLVPSSSRSAQNKKLTLIGELFILVPGTGLGQALAFASGSSSAWPHRRLRKASGFSALHSKLRFDRRSSPPFKSFVNTENKKLTLIGELFILVPGTGLEPACPCGRVDQNHVRLPVSPPGHLTGKSQSYVDIQIITGGVNRCPTTP